MKINWGWGIVISFVLFIGFMGYFVFRIQTEKKLNHSLVNTAYYKEELKVEGHLTALINGKPWSDSLQLFKTSLGLSAKPLPLNQMIHIEGYRASDEKKDFEFLTLLKNNPGVINDSLLTKGKWKISFSWITDDVTYLIEKEIYY